MMIARTPVPLRRAQLREATQVVHGQLDARFAHGLRTAREYATYLLGMHAFVANAERALAAGAASPAWQAFVAQERTGWLQHDLAATGLSPLAAGPALQAGTDADVAGLLYVIEGSALGATQLVPDAVALGWGPDRGAAFLHQHGGPGAGPRWRSFLHSLESASFGPDAQQAMLASAARAFASVEHEFRRAALAAAPGEEA